MSLNDLAARAVVLFVDQQEGIAERGSSADPKTAGKMAATLARAAQIYDIPIVVSAVALGMEPKLIKPLRDCLGQEHRILTRVGTDSFDDETIKGTIEATGRKTLLLSGVVTEVAVQRAALHALEEGYEVRVVLDACNGASERSEKASMERMVHAGIIMTSVPQTLGELATNFSDPKAQQAIGLLMGG